MMTSRRFLSLALSFAGLACAAAVGAQTVTELRPNLKALPASDIRLATTLSGTPEIRFAGSSWNAGLGALEIRPGETGTGGQNVYQRVYLSNGTYYDRLAGTFIYHPEHDHIHFDNYATYTLQSATANGQADRLSQKTSFCLEDIRAIDLTLPGAPPLGVYTTCTRVKQGISVGWGDVYGYTLFGQSIDITGLPAGDYRLKVTIDPLNRIIETNDTDNESCVLLRLATNPLALTVLNPNGCTVQAPPQITAITPNVASAGSVVAVTITGSNFAPGSTVSLQNGSGPAPIVTNVVVKSATTITAAITVKKKGNYQKDPSWDVRVDSGTAGSAVLPNAFFVAP